MIQMIALLSLTFLATTAAPQVCLAWVQTPKNYRLATFGLEESQSTLADGVEEVILLGLKSDGVVAEGSRFVRNAVLINRIDFATPKTALFRSGSKLANKPVRNIWSQSISSRSNIVITPRLTR